LLAPQEKNMINKKNWKLTNQYLDDRLHVDQISQGSLGVEKTYLRYLLEWADVTHFSKARKITPTFPEYMKTARLDNKKGSLSPTHINKILSTARRFFMWLFERGGQYRSLKPSWIKKIRSKRLTAIPQTKEYVSYEDILEIDRIPARTAMERRIQAAAVLMYLTGIRVGALVTLPIKAVDLKNRFIYQYPSLGVHTKNNKSAKTVIYPIPELLAVVQAWDNEIREVLPEDGFWFAPLLPESGEIDPNNLIAKDSRVSLVQKNLRKFLRKYGLPERSPHKFRHGHVHYGQAHSRNQADYKAVSQNVMHSTTGITDQFYSNMGDQEKKNRIDSMFNNKSESEEKPDEYALFREFLSWKDANK